MPWLPSCGTLIICAVCHDIPPWASLLPQADLDMYRVNYHSRPILLTPCGRQQARAPFHRAQTDLIISAGLGSRKPLGSM